MRKGLIALMIVTGVAIVGIYMFTLPQEATSNEKARENGPPQVILMYPRGGESLSGKVEIRWLAQDPDNDVLMIKIQYTSDPPPFCPSCPPQSWHDIAEDIENTGIYTWDTARIPDGKYILRITASDGISEASEESGWIFVSNG